MKRIMYVILALFIASISYGVKPTYMPTGLSTYDDDRDTMKSSTTISGIVNEGDVWVKGRLIVGDSIISLSTFAIVSVNDFYQNCPAADSDTLKAASGAYAGIVISTNVLISKATCFVDQTYFSMPKYGHPLCGAFEVKWDSNYATGYLDFTGVTSQGNTIKDRLTMLSSTKTYTNYAYVEILSSTLTITTCPGMRGEPSGSLDAYDDSAKVYPRFGTGLGIGLSNFPISNTIDQAYLDDTWKDPSLFAICFTTSGVVYPTTAPSGTAEHQYIYRAIGNIGNK